MDDASTILLRWCKQRAGIRLRSSFVQSWKIERTITNTETAYMELLADFKCKDISLTSEPVIPENFGTNALGIYPEGPLRQGGGVVLQIQDTIDLSNSTFSLLNNLDVGGQLPRGVLRWTLTDGTRQIQAMEMETIEELNLKTPFGCKLLIQNCKVKRGMLLLTKNGIKVLGGEVPELYGGNMVKELENRFRIKLGLSTVPRTNDEPTPPTNTHHPSASRNEPTVRNNTTTPNFTANNESNVRNNTTAPTPNEPTNRSFTNSTMDTRGSTLINEIDDTNDVDMDVFDSMDMDMLDTTIAEQDIPPTWSDDDDAFVTTPPPTINLSRTRPPINNPPPSTTPLSRTRSPPPVNNSPPQKRRREEGSPVIVKKEREPEPVEEEVWYNFSEDEDDLPLDSQGRAQIPFDTLFTVLTEMNNNSYTGKIADTVVVKAKFIKISKIKYSTLSGFYVIFDIANPDKPDGDVVKVVVSHKLFVELLKLEPDVLANMPNLMKNKTAIRKIIVPFESGMKSKLAELEIDLSLTEKAATENGQDIGQIVAPCQKYTFI